MFIAHGQSQPQLRIGSGRLPRRSSRVGHFALLGHSHGVECLENRRLLSATPIAPPLGPAPAAWLGSIEVVGPLEMSQGASGRALEGPSDGPATPEAPMTFPREQAVRTFDAPLQRIATQEVSWEGGAMTDRPEPTAVEIVLIPAASIGHEETVLAPKFFAQPQVDEPLFADRAIVHVDLFKAPPGSISANEQETFSSLRVPGPRGFDPEFERAVFFVSEGWQPGDLGAFSVPNEITFDVRERPADSLRLQFSDGRLAMSPLDGVRASNGALAYFDAATDVERHAAAGGAALFGQSAEGEAPFAGGRAVGMARFGELGNAGDLSGPMEVAEQSTVGYLVALEEAFRAAALGAYSATVDTAQVGVEQAASSLVHEVLMPHFAFDAAALSTSLQELAAQADELGVGLWEMLSPIASGEAALVAGIVSAGIVYRHWRGTRRDERAEEQDLLSSRFIRGHASIRIAGGPS